MISGAGLVVLLLWTTGLVSFALSLPRVEHYADHPIHKTDAIVVLTGGAERIETGLALLAGGVARKLFISGVYQGIDVSELLRSAREFPDELACCVDLGHEARNTTGNARETAHWMVEQEYRSLRLVTASYHMPRSLAEFRHAMKGVEIVPHPVFPSTFAPGRWWQPGNGSYLIVSEYTKYLLAKFFHLFSGPVATIADSRIN